MRKIAICEPHEEGRGEVKFISRFHIWGGGKGVNIFSNTSTVREGINFFLKNPQYKIFLKKYNPKKALKFHLIMGLAQQNNLVSLGFFSNKTISY